MIQKTKLNLVKKWINPSPYERRDAALGWKVILEDVVKHLRKPYATVHHPEKKEKREMK